MGKNPDAKPHHVHRESFLEKGKLPPLPGLGAPLNAKAPTPAKEQLPYGAEKTLSAATVKAATPATYEKEQAIAPEVRRTMNELASFLAEELKPNGFSLLVFPFSNGEKVDQGRINYISNAERKDMLRAMRQFIDKNEAEHGGERLDAVLVRRYFRAMHDETYGKDFNPRHPIIAAICIIEECMSRMTPDEAERMAWIIADMMISPPDKLKKTADQLRETLVKDR
jgi:hypothetical protein